MIECRPDTIPPASTPTKSSVQDPTMSLLVRWENFYVIVGSAGAALTGLQFVVMALIAESRQKSSPDAIDAFGTPTIVHFCVVLLVSSVLSAPWQDVSNAALLLTACGVLGVGYVMVVTRRAARQTDYRPVLEDWIWHTALPFTAYAVLLAGSIALFRYAASGLFVIASSLLLLLFIGIHNAWDTVTYVATSGLKHTTPTQEDDH